MAKTISGYSTIGVTLAVNPTTIAGTIATALANAVTGSAAKTWTLANHGTVRSANGDGIVIGGGLQLSNAAGALISGDYAAILVNKSASFSNAGTITATASYGAAILLEDPVNDSITNSAKGVIAGGIGIESVGTSTILNQGLIQGTNLFDVGVDFRGRLDNAKGGTIIGGAVGVAMFGASTLIDGGLIESSETNGAAIFLGTSIDNQLILKAGATVIGSIDDFLAGDTIDETGITITADSFSAGTLTLYDGTAAAGTLHLFGGFNTSAFDLKSDGKGGTDILLGAETFAGTYNTELQLSAFANTIAATGRVSSPFLSLYGDAYRNWTLLNEGTILAGDTGIEMRGGGTISNAAHGLIESNFGVQLGPGALLDAGTIIGTSGPAIYIIAGTSGGTEITLETGAVVQGAIAGFGDGDTIDLAAISATGATFGGGVLSLTNAGAVVDEIALDGLFTSNAFIAGTAAGGSTDIVMAPAETFSGHYGVRLTLAALFTSIATGAYFASSTDAVIGPTSQNWTLVNSGTVDAFSYGVQLARGQVSNTGAGLIEGNIGVRTYDANLINAGTIIGTDGFRDGSGFGIEMYGTAGSARNLAGGRISSLYVGAGVNVGTLKNAGAISGTIGVQLDSGSLLNSGLVTGLGGSIYKSYLDAGLRIINGFASNAAAGVISGPTGATIQSGTLINAGHILGLPGGYRRGPEEGEVSVASAGILLTGGRATNTGTGTISGDYGAQLDGGTLIDAGTIASTIGVNGIAIAFGAAHATLVLDKGNVVDGAISGFAAGDVIDFAGTSITSETFKGGIITLKDGTSSVEKLSITGSLTTKDFSLVSEGTAGTELILKKGAANAMIMQFVRPDPCWDGATLAIAALPPGPQAQAAVAPDPGVMGWLTAHPTTAPGLVAMVTLHSI
jgi:hypothetical protein